MRDFAQARDTDIDLPIGTSAEEDREDILDRDMHHPIPRREESMSYRFGDLVSEIQDDWIDDIATNPTHQHKWRQVASPRASTEKVLAPWVYATTDVPEMHTS